MVFIFLEKKIYKYQLHYVKMKKEVLSVLLLVLVLFISSFVSAYSITGRVIDDIRMNFASGDAKAGIAMDIRDKEIEVAIENVKEGDLEKAIENLERAKEKLEIIQKEASFEMAEDIKVNTEEITNKIEENKNVNPEFAVYFENHIIEEEKTQLFAELSQRLFNYCLELASQDYELMLQDEKCNPENAPEWLGNGIGDKMEEGQEESAGQMLEIFTTCVSDPRDCDCSEISIASEKIKCEKGKALAIRCEFQTDESACKELNNLNIEMPSNLPKFLQPIFKEKINDAINKKEKETFNEFSPPECVEANARTREECESVMMEKHAPKECVEAGATTKKECEKIMIGIHGPPPTECTENGEFMGEEACNEKMVSFGKIPDECIDDGKPISPEECNVMMAEKGMMGQPEMGPPPECEGLSKEECNQIMGEMGIRPGMQTAPSGAEWGGNQIIPQECVGMTFQECEDSLMGNYMPSDCINAGALTPEDCKRTMLSPECKQAGALSREECGTIMIKKDMPEECQNAGASSPEKCAKLMSKNIVVGGTPGSEVDYLNKKGINFDEIPDVCVSGSNFIRSMECDEALAGMGITLPPPSDVSNIPQECIQGGVPVSPQECETILQGRIMNENIPGPCREAGITDPEKCGRFMEKEKRNAGMGMMDLPPECLTMSVLECNALMEEQGMNPVDVMGIMGGELEPGEIQAPEVKMSIECSEMGISDGSACGIVMSKINEERIKNGDKMVVDDEGNENYISNDEINKIVDETERIIDEYEPDLDLATEIKSEVEIIEKDIVELEESVVEIEEAPEPELSSESEQKSAPEPESSPEPEQESSPEPEPESEPPATGEAVREIEGKGFLSKLFDRIFG
jgi:hypothetical protein